VLRTYLVYNTVVLGKKISSCLSGRCTIVITTGKKVLVVCIAGAQLGPIYAKSSDFYAKLNVSNLNVTILY
jgi:hypothetical protein